MQVWVCECPLISQIPTESFLRSQQANPPLKLAAFSPSRNGPGKGSRGVSRWTRPDLQHPPHITVHSHHHRHHHCHHGHRHRHHHDWLSAPSLSAPPSFASAPPRRLLPLPSLWPLAVAEGRADILHGRSPAIHQAPAFRLNQKRTIQGRVT